MGERIWNAAALAIAAIAGSIVTDPGPLADYPIAKWAAAVIATGVLAALRGSPAKS